MPMQLEDLARAILYGASWEDKLLADPAFEDAPRSGALTEVPVYPGRPAYLARIGRAEFPKLERLADDSARGQVLHFFANHELLAMELMALMLLRFPDAPQAFRAGIARTIFEEQTHLRLYVERMRELGVEFGELPVNDYFWKAMKDMDSPLQFVTQMSLTLEQANLDYSLYYQQAVARVGDQKTAAILERVYREEIGHVKHGLVWFNRWRDSQGEDDWDAYLRLLPPPMTPRRAKGIQFSAESRREAGFSERYIREIEVYAGSKGRPPVFWLYNPLCDAEIARGKPGLSPSEPVRRLSLDLEHLPMMLAIEQDVVLVQELPDPSWLKAMQELGFTPPEFRRLGRVDELPRENHVGGLEPWGWSPEPFERFKPWRDRLLHVDGANAKWAKGLLGQENFGETGIGELFAKSWSSRYLRDWLESHPEDEQVFGPLASVGETYLKWEPARARLERAMADGRTWLAKAPYGTSGTQNKRVLDQSEIDGKIGGWIRNTLESQGCIVLEPWLHKLADLSMQIEVGEESVKIVGIRQFLNGARLEYRGTELDPKLGALPEPLRRFLHADPFPLERWRRFARELGHTLRERGYLGPAGLDAMIWEDPDTHKTYLRPLVELNPRWTMGRVAIALEGRVLPGARARWMFIPLRELPARGLPPSAAEAAKLLRERHPVRTEPAGGGPRVAEGVVFTSDPARAREVLTLLVVGERACEDRSLAQTAPESWA